MTATVAPATASTVPAYRVGSLRAHSRPGDRYEQDGDQVAEEGRELGGR